MSERFNSPPEATPPAPTPAELKRRLNELNNMLAEYNSLIHSGSSGGMDTKRADEMLAAILIKKAVLTEAVNPSQYEILLRDGLARALGYTFLSEFSARGVALGVRKEIRNEFGSVEFELDLVRRDGTRVRRGMVSKYKNFSDGFLPVIDIDGTPRYITEDGESALPETFKHVEAFDVLMPFEFGMAVALRGENKYIITKEGKMWGPYFGAIERKGVTLFAHRDNDAVDILVQRGSPFGPCTLIWQTFQDEPLYRDNGKMLVEKRNGDDGKYIFDLHGTHAPLGPFVSVRGSGSYFVAWKHGKGMFVIDPHTLNVCGPYGFVGEIGSDMARVKIDIDDKKFRYVNLKTGKLVQSNNLDGDLPYAGGVVFTKPKGTLLNAQGVVCDRQGKVLPDYRKHLEFEADGFAPITKKYGEWYFVDKSFQEFGPFEDIRKFKNGFMLDGDGTMLSKRNQRYGPYEYSVWVSGTTYVCLKPGGKHVILTLDGEFPTQFDSTTTISEYQGNIVYAWHRPDNDLSLLRINDDGSVTELVGPSRRIEDVGCGFASVTVRSSTGAVGQESEFTEYVVHVASGKKLGPFISDKRIWNAGGRNFKDGTYQVIDPDTNSLQFIDMNGKRVFALNV